MNIISDIKKCTGCSACYNSCGVGAIKMESDENGFLYPKVDESKCVKCLKCQRACPVDNKSEVKNNPLYYICKNKDEDIRKKSSSGGIFTILAQYVVESGGVVYGAGFDNEWKVVHTRADSAETLQCLRGSKYVQSEIGSTFSDVKKDLDNGKKVLFSGTPCQIGGLVGFLGKREYENLITVDLICHGVPSPKVWKKYLDELNHKYSATPVEVNFRYKDNHPTKPGFSNYMYVEYENSCYKKNRNDDVYWGVFLSDLPLRDSCFDCSFKGKHRQSDFTLADFLGIDRLENIDKDFTDNKGISLVIVNSEKAQKIFDIVSDKMILRETDFEKSIIKNQMMISSAIAPFGRNGFFKNLEKYNIEQLYKKYYVNGEKFGYGKVIRKLKTMK